jgi:hypothetical protein
MDQIPVEESIIRMQADIKALEKRVAVLEGKKTKKTKADKPTEIIPTTPGYEATDEDLPKEFQGAGPFINPYPTHQEFTEYKLWANNFAAKLKGLGMANAGKILTEFILAETKNEKGTDITKVQWIEIQERLAKIADSELVSLVGRTL